jgi:hypothetical protein
VETGQEVVPTLDQSTPSVPLSMRLPFLRDRKGALVSNCCFPYHPIKPRAFCTHLLKNLRKILGVP